LTGFVALSVGTGLCV